MAMLRRIVQALKETFNTQNDVLLFTCSGTGVLEAAVSNTLSPGDPVLAFSAGSFGDRLAEIAQAYGAVLTKIDVEWGSPILPDQVVEALRRVPEARAVLMTHNETSTGVLHPIEEIARAVRANSNGLLIVDAVSSLGAVPVQTDAWGIDLLATASQKAWMCPPGLAMLSVSPRAWQAYEQARSPRYYFDFAAAKKWIEKGQTPFTPAISTIFALDAALKLIQMEGPAHVYTRHLRVAQRTRSLGMKLGLSLFGDERYASPTVTAFSLPANIDGDRLRQIARDEFGLIIGGGQGKLKGKIVRIGHLGYVHEQDVDAAMDALGRALARMRG
jgi:aspartate aminotransferase-like enzyme